MTSNTKRMAVLGAAILGLAAVVWVAVNATSRPSGDLAAPSAGAHSETTQASERSIGSSAAASVEEQRVVASQPAVGARDEATALTLEIVRADTGAPCPGATVHWWSSRVLERVRGGFDAWLIQSAVEEHHAEAVAAQADENGVVKFFDALGGGVVTASLDGWWARAAIEPGRHERIKLSLLADVDLRAWVIDTNGLPVTGCAVVLRQLGHASHTDHLCARSDKDGIAVLRHAGLWWSADSSMATGYVVAIPGLLDPPCARVLDVKTVESQPIELVLDPGGWCAVELFDGFGRKLLEPFEARLCFTDAAQACETAVAGPSAGAVFEQVGIGRELQVEVRRSGANGVSTTRAMGPSYVGERIHLRVELQAQSLSCSGRVVDSTGTPLGELMLSAQLETGDGWIAEQAWSTRTNGDGEFLLELKAPPATSDSLTLVLSAQKGTDPTRVFARRALPRELSPAAHALGEIVLEDAPLVAGGRVLDPKGDPVADAVVTAVAPTASDEPGGPPRESQSSLLTTRSDAEGRFSLRGITAADEIVVRAHKSGYVERAERTRRGQSSLRLVLGEAGTITGKVELDRSLRSAAVLVEAVPDQRGSANGLEPTLEPTLIANGGVFTIRDLRAGTYSLRVTYGADGSELGRVDNVIVESGRANTDERLNPLDLKAARRLIELELVDEEGEAIRGGGCRTRHSDDPTSAPIGTVALGNRLPLLFDGRPLDVTVSAPGFLEMELQRVNETRRVTLLRSAKLRLELAGGLPALDAKLRLGVRLTPADARRPLNPGSPRTALFDDRGVLVCETPFAGEVKIELMLTTSDAENSRAEYLKSSTPRTVRLAAHSQEQAFKVAFEPSDLTRAIEALRSER